MEEWFSMVIRQGIFYSFPLIITFSVLWMVELHFKENANYHQNQPSLLQSNVSNILLPFLVSLLLGRGVMFAWYPFTVPFSDRPKQGLHLALQRAGVHLLLCWLGWILYAWALDHAPSAGLPPLHHWWAKVLMYFNLCMLALHLMPLPRMVVGELLFLNPKFHSYQGWLEHRLNGLVVTTLIAASPLPDLLLGGVVIFPVYEWMASIAAL